MDILFATCRRKPDFTASDRLVASALAARGVTVDAVPWDRLPSSSPSLVCVRSTWDYHLNPGAFRQWVTGFQHRPGTLWNPPQTLLWNIDKAYLQQLVQRGIATPKTHWLAPGVPIDPSALLHEAGWTRGVLKPRISASAHGTFLVHRDMVLPPEEVALLQPHGALLQEFVPEVQSRGEVSLLFIDGQFSHAVRKLTAPGDFRVQSDHGGTVEPERASRELREFSAAVLDAAARPWLYARVDVIESANGPVLMELELIEPELFLTYSSEAVTRFAEALLRHRKAAVESSSQLPLANAASAQGG